MYPDARPGSRGFLFLPMKITFTPEEAAEILLHHCYMANMFNGLEKGSLKASIHRDEDQEIQCEVWEDRE